MTSPLSSCNSNRLPAISNNLLDSRRQDIGAKMMSTGNSDVALASGCSSPDRSLVDNGRDILTNPVRTAFLDMSGNIPVLSVTQNESEVPMAAKVAPGAKSQSSAPVNIAELDPTVKDNPKPESSKINNIIKTVGKVVSLTIAVLAVAIPVAAALGIPVASLVIAQGVVVILAVLLCAYAATRKDMAALLIGSWAMTKAKQVQWAAAALIGWLSSLSNRASWQGQKFAMGFSYIMSKSFEKRGASETGMACANAIGAGIGTVDRKAHEQGIKANEAMYYGTAVGVAVGSVLLNGVNGSSEMGALAGAGAFNGATVGRKVDDLGAKGVELAMAGVGSASVLLDAYWRFWLPEIFPARPEGERCTGGKDTLFYSADLNKHDEGYVTGLVNAYWRFWLHDTVAPAHTQRSAYTVGNDMTFIEKDELATANSLWRESRESPSIVPRGSRLNKAMPDAQRSRPVREGTANGQVDAGLGEWLGAYTGGIAGGLYAGLDNQSGGRFKHAASAIGKQISAVRNSMGAGVVVPRRLNAVFPEID